MNHVEQFESRRLLSSLAWSAYAGGSDADQGNAIAADAAGTVFVAGQTDSASWISGGSDTIYGGNTDAFLIKRAANGQPLWSTYLGGAEGDWGNAVAVDAAGNVLVAGTTSSAGWVSSGFDTTLAGLSDGFVAKLGPNGQLLWSTYVGGSADDSINGIAVDGAGNIFVTGTTSLAGWTSGGYQTAYAGGDSDAFIVKLNAAGQHLWSTYVGGSGIDQGAAIALDGGGNALVTGYTESAGWTSGGYNTTLNGYYDGFVVKVNSAGQHAWSTYLDGSLHAAAIAADPSSNVLVTGDPGFLIKLTSAGQHQWSATVGGTDYTYCKGIGTDVAGNAFVTGGTATSDWLTGGFNNNYGGGLHDAFVLAFTPAGQQGWGSYIGGTGDDFANALALDSAANILVTGYSDADGWTSGQFGTTYNGGYYDAFVARILETPSGVTSGAVVVAADVSGASAVRVFDPTGTQLLQEFHAFDGFPGGTRVAIGDVNGDGTSDIIAGTAEGACHVKVFDGRNYQVISSFLAFPGATNPSDPNYFALAFTGGIYVASGDINADGKADIVVGAGPGAGPHVKGFSGADGSLLQSFWAYDPGFQGGVRIAAGDIDGDGKADVVTGSGSASPHVRAFSGASGSMLANYFAYDPGFQQGIYVAAGDTNGDGRSEIITATGVGPPHVKVFANAGATLVSSFFAYDTNFLGGVRVGVADINGDGTDEMVTGTGPGAAHVKVFAARTFVPTLLDSFIAFGNYAGGVYVA